MDSGRKGILGRRIHAGKAWIRERRQAPTTDRGWESFDKLYWKGIEALGLGESGMLQ